MLKNLLRAFGKASAMNAFPSTVAISIPIKPDHWWNVFVAPSDGYVTAQGATKKGVVNAAFVDISAGLGSYSVSDYGAARATIPVRKGHEVLIAARGDEKIEAFFIPAKASQ